MLILPVLAVFRRPALQYSQYSESEMYSILRVYSEYKVQGASLHGRRQPAATRAHKEELNKNAK